MLPRFCISLEQFSNSILHTTGSLIANAAFEGVTFTVTGSLSGLSAITLILKIGPTRLPEKLI